VPGLRHVDPSDKKDAKKDEKSESPKQKKELKKETPKRIPTLTVTQQQLANKKNEVWRRCCFSSSFVSLVLLFSFCLNFRLFDHFVFHSCLFRFFIILFSIPFSRAAIESRHSATEWREDGEVDIARQGEGPVLAQGQEGRQGCIDGDNNEQCFDSSDCDGWCDDDRHFRRRREESRANGSARTCAR
jgi:hypothetical protein